MAWTIPVLLSALTLSAGPAPGVWNEAMAQAIEKGSQEGIRACLKQRNTGNPLEIDFARAVAAWKASGSKKDIGGVLARNLQGPLTAAFGSNSPAVYSSLLENAATPGPAKEILLQAMIAKGRKADPAQAQAIRAKLKGVAAHSALPIPLRAEAIRGLAVQRDVRNGDSAYLPYLQGTDSTLKSAAYWALGMQIIANSERQRAGENERLFPILKSLADSEPGEYPIRALAQLGMDAARDHLALKCAGDAQKILIVLRHDPYPKHPGILAEALKVEPGSQSGQALRSEIRARIRRPDGVVSGLLGGTNVQIETGLKLLGTFPALVPKYGAAIEGFKGNPDFAIRTAALALAPLASHPNSAAE